MNFFDSITITFILLKLKKFLVFAAAYALVSYFAVKFLRRRKPETKYTDIEVIFIAALGGVAISKLVLMGIRIMFGV